VLLGLPPPLSDCFFTFLLLSSAFLPRRVRHHFPQRQPEHQPRDPRHQQVHSHQNPDRPHRARRPVQPDHPAQRQRDNPIQQQPPRRSIPLHPEIRNHFHHSLRQDDHRQQQRQRRRGHEGVRQKIISPDQVHDRHQHLKNHLL